MNLLSNSPRKPLPDLRRSPTARAVSRAFTPPPPGELWEWADQNVMLLNEDAAEPGHYRSSKTPWTRRLQELIMKREMYVWDATAQKYVLVPVQEISIQKSSQSGFSEACLNGVRWRAMYRPCNVIYVIDSAEEARKIGDRLLRSLKFLDKSIFTGDPSDIRSLWFQLRGMSVLFYGSFSSGKFANKQAPFVIADEVEEHGQATGDTTTLRNLASRKKSSTRGLQVNLSKPKLVGGPINKAHAVGNKEECCVPCPHCGWEQPLTFFPEEIDSPFSEEIITLQDEQSGKVLARLPQPLPPGQTRKVTTGRLVFEHCKDLLGKWDKYRILRETYYECGKCKGHIDEGRHKRWMLDRLVWFPTTLDGTPGFVSQHINDLYSEDEMSAWGQLVLDYLNAKDEGLVALQGFYNHRLGKAWSEDKSATEEKDILDNIAGKNLWFVDAPDVQGQPRRHRFHDEPSAQLFISTAKTRGVTASLVHSFCRPYRRGEIPFTPLGGDTEATGAILLGSDVGGNYAKWVAAAIAPNGIDYAVIDWGTEIGPDEILTVCRNKMWLDPNGKKHRITQGFIDVRFRPEDVYRVCIASRKLLIPSIGIGGAAAASVRLFTFNKVPTYERFNLKKLDFNKQRALDSLYRDRIKLMRRRCFFPIDVTADPEFIEELCSEFQIDVKGRLVWSDTPRGPNHYGDALDNVEVGFNYLTRAE